MQDRPAFVLKPVSAQREQLPSAFLKTAPESVEDLESMQAHIQEVVARVSPAVVAVRVRGATGSGVVISEDGYVLCAAHVGGEPNQRADFTFPDGRRARGITMGANHTIDSGLLKITEDGPWPHATIGDLDETALGDWTLALGHPGGFDPQRSMVVRLGRLVSKTPGALRTDCTLIGGDSGGPLFDMNGQVIGIHSRIAGSMAANFHVPVGTFVETWDRLVNSESWEERRSPQPYVGAGGVEHPEGIRLELVDDNGPAFKAGLRVGDVVVKINGEPISNHTFFYERVTRAKPGEELTLDVKRDETALSLRIQVGEYPPRRRR